MTRSRMSIAETVEMTALELVNRHSLDEIERVLTEQGVLPRFASKLVLLVPSAFAAAAFEPEGIVFPELFQVGPPDKLRLLPYAGEPGYLEAKELAQRWLEERPSFVARVLDWSAEANCIKEAKSRGLTPSDLAFVHHGDVW